MDKLFRYVSEIYNAYINIISCFVYPTKELDMAKSFDDHQKTMEKVQNLVSNENIDEVILRNFRESFPDASESTIQELYDLVIPPTIKALGEMNLQQSLPKTSFFMYSSELINIFSQVSGEAYLLFGIFVIFCYSLFNSKSKRFSFPLMQTNTIYLCVLSLILTICLLSNHTSLLNLSDIESSYTYTIFQNHFSQNSFYLFLKQVLLGIVLIIYLLALTYTRYNNNVSYEFSILLLLSTWAMCLLISSTDLISIYLVIELQSFCFYILTATKSHSNFSTEAGLKYFILGSFSSGLLLFGISILYGFTGLTNLDELKIFFHNYNLDFIHSNNIAIIFALILIITGILFKFGLVPFHMYVPDAYTGAPTIITTLFLVIQKFVILILYINLYNSIFIYFSNNLNYFIIFSILASIILGSVTALAQSKIKRLVAYSAIVNGGYLLLGIAVGTTDGFSSSLLFLFIYISLILTLFTIYLSVKNRYNDHKLAGFKDFILLKKGNIMLAISFCLVLFSIAGIPPLAGFYGKLFLFTSVIKEGSYALALIAILFTVVTAYYYIRLVKIMFFEKTLKFGFFTQVSKIDAYLISLGTLFNLVFFAMPKLFFVLINSLVLQFYFYL